MVMQLKYWCLKEKYIDHIGGLKIWSVVLSSILAQTKS